MRAKSDARVADMRANGVRVIEEWDCQFTAADEKATLAEISTPLLPKIDEPTLSQEQMIEAIRTENVEGFVLCSL